MKKTRNILQFLGISWVATCSSAFGKRLQATHGSRHLMLIDAAADPRQWKLKNKTLVDWVCHYRYHSLFCMVGTKFC
jgi:hypothetical protein